jgi:nucleotide-binding universal stress UspA family protein
MNTILGFSTDQRTDEVVAQRVLTLAKDRGADLVVLVAHDDAHVILGQKLPIGDHGDDTQIRAVAMAGPAREAGFATDTRVTDGSDGDAMHTVCQQYAPTTIIIGTPKHRVLGDLWDEPSVRHAKKHTDNVEALHED